MSKFTDFRVVEVPKQTVYNVLMSNHYLKRLPPISFAFGLYSKDFLKGVCTFGSPPSKDLCIGLCGPQYKDEVLELNRLFLVENIKNLASFFVSKCLAILPRPKLVISYADTSANHHGYIYQATNFIYTGLSAKRKDVVGDRHSRTIKWDKDKAVDRPRKHRYLYICGTKKQKRERLNDLRYPILEYPKGDNKNYTVGDVAPMQGLLL
tara:strand:- start:31 stop:654 length:624 start_codon:yes stop_codon:yes gene_type:complete